MFAGPSAVLSGNSPGHRRGAIFSLNHWMGVPPVTQAGQQLGRARRRAEHVAAAQTTPEGGCLTGWSPTPSSGLCVRDVAGKACQGCLLDVTALQARAAPDRWGRDEGRACRAHGGCRTSPVLSLEPRHCNSVPSCTHGAPVTCVSRGRHGLCPWKESSWEMGQRCDPVGGVWCPVLGQEAPGPDVASGEAPRLSLSLLLHASPAVSVWGLSLLCSDVSFHTATSASAPLDRADVTGTSWACVHLQSSAQAQGVPVACKQANRHSLRQTLPWGRRSAP